jgi:lipopolysaccharide export system ATP-binding protein
VSSTLKISNLTKAFGPQPVLQNLSIEIAPKEFVSILGSSGSGKTTLLRLIAGFDTPDTGEISIAGNKVAAEGIFVAAQARKVGYVPQDAALFPHLNVFENIAFGLKGLSKEAKVSRVRTLLDLVQMSAFESSDSSSLSGGQKHRVALARALAPEPELILLDEPFAGIDPIAVIEIQRIIGFLKARGMGVLITDHNVRETLGICDHACIISDGRVLAQGTPAEIIENADVRRVYLGEHFRM